MGIWVIDDKASLAEHVKKVTAKIRAEQEVLEVPTTDVPKSELVKGLESVMEKADFGCQSVHVSRAFAVIVKAITGEHVEFKSDDEYSYWDVKFAAIVPVKNENGHNYPMDSASIALGGRRGVMVSGSLGNHLPVQWDHVRLATDEEIDDFFENFEGPDSRLLSFF